MPVEMDCLRAMGKKTDVVKTWDRIQDLEPSPTVSHEARVVYASFLLDEGRARDTWAIIKPGRLVAYPFARRDSSLVCRCPGGFGRGRQRCCSSIGRRPRRAGARFRGIDEFREALA